MQIARILMKTIVANNGQFNEESFRQAYIDFMTEKGSHNDAYASTCHRMFFANMIFNKKDPKDCPDNDGHNVDTIDGLILPTITALAETARQLSSSGNTSLQLSEESERAIENASARTAAVTRSSQLLENVSKVWSSLVSAALITPNTSVSSMEPSLLEVAQKLRMSRPSPNRKDQMSACYLSQSLPPTLDMLNKYTQTSFLEGTDGIWKALLNNANTGGENVHRAAVLGAILGARVGDEHLPPQLKFGLYEREALEKEIDAFVNAIMQKNEEKEL